MPTVRKSQDVKKHQSSTFLRSVHIERDATNQDAIDRYVLTSNASRAIERIASRISEGGSTVWTLTGSYGTGKSAFLLFLSHLLGPKGNDLTSSAVKMLHKSNPDLAAEIFSTSRFRYGLAAIRVSAANEPISKALVRGLVEAKQYGILQLNATCARHLRDFEQDISNEKNIDSSKLLSFLEQVIVPRTRRGSKSGPLLLLIDEMGKLLEFAADHPQASDVFLLQQLAELAARSRGDLVVITTLHQDFQVYANNLTASDRIEWEKIRGRFEDVAFEEPATQLLRFVASAWERICEIQEIDILQRNISQVRNLASDLWEFGIAPAGLQLRDGVELLKSCAPMHPIVAVLLGPLFRRVGQNERSAFSFLLSEEPQSLQSVIRHRSCDNGLFTVEDLFRYLVSSLGNALLNTPDAKRWAEALEAESRHPQLSRSAISVLRTIAVLAIASRWTNVKASIEVLEHALNGQFTSKEITSALHELESASVIVYRRFNSSYVLWEGSDVDVEARLAEGRESLRETGSVALLLQDYYQLSPLLARRHSFNSGTLRFFEVSFSSVAQLARFQESSHQDGRIVIVVPSSHDEYRRALDAIMKIEDRTIIRLLDSSGPLSELALELGAIRWVNDNTPEIDNDSTARRELHARQLAVFGALDEIVNGLLGASSRIPGKWYRLGQEVDIRSSRSLNEELSNICDIVFDAAPQIDNEIINRRELSSSAAAARRNLIERMITSADQEELGLADIGNPPERSVYRSLLGNEGLQIHRKVRGQWAFRKPTKHHEGRQIIEQIDEYFDSASDSRQSIEGLIDLLKSPPYGLREGPIPILICSALLIRDQDVALYEDGCFCPKLTPAIMERLVKSPDLFSIRRWRVSGIRSQVFEQLEKLVLGNTGEGPSGKKRMLQIARPMIRFINQLPDYTISTSDVSGITSAIRDAFTQATEPDVLIFEQLPRACGIETFESKQNTKVRKKDVHYFAECIKTAFTELRSAYPNLVTTVRVAIADAFGLSTSDPDSIQPYLQAIASDLSDYTAERDLKMLVDRISDDVDSDNWIEGVASFIAERPLAKWRDVDRAHFNVRLQQFVRRINLLSATVSGRPTDASSNTQSLRFALTSTEFGQFDHVVHIDTENAKRLPEIEKAIEKEALKASDTTIAIAALARVVRRLLAPNNSETDKRGGKK